MTTLAWQKRRGRRGMAEEVWQKRQSRRGMAEEAWQKRHGRRDMQKRRGGRRINTNEGPRTRDDQPKIKY